MSHHHLPRCTGRRITAVFGKDNLPAGKKSVVSTGCEALCDQCGARLIVHDPRRGFAEWFTELAA